MCVCKLLISTYALIFIYNSHYIIFQFSYFLFYREIVFLDTERYTQIYLAGIMYKAVWSFDSTYALMFIYNSHYIIFQFSCSLLQGNSFS